MGISIDKVGMAQNAPAPAAAAQAVAAQQPAPKQAVSQQVVQQAAQQPSITQQAMRQPAVQGPDASQEQADVTQKKPAEKAAPEKARKYYTANDLKTATGMSSDILKLNDDLRNIAKQSFQYQTDIDEIKKEIDGSDSNDPAKLERDTAELSSLKAQLNEADTDRMRKINEIRTKYAGGTYKVNSMDVVNSWD